MKYVSVTSPSSSMSIPIFNRFDSYLVSLGEPTTSRTWTLSRVANHMVKLLREKKDHAPKSKLYIDSGGYQIIVGYISFKRIREYIDTYHFILERYKDDIDQIFALDVFNSKYIKSLNKNSINKKFNINDYKELYNINKYSMMESISLINKYPEIADKQLFILQSGNNTTFNIWKELFKSLEAYKYYRRWSIGGLVGLKKSTNARFSHAVPATLWLLTYQKHFDFKIDQMHWLGQSSRLSFLSMALFEKLYNINMTSDSSQLVRFAPIDHKYPLMFNEAETNNFKLIERSNDSENDLDICRPMLDTHSIECVSHFDKNSLSFDEEIKSLNTQEWYDKYGRFHNTDFIELQSQNIAHEIKFANYIVNIIVEKGILEINSPDDLSCLHPIMARGRIAKELFNNIVYFQRFDSIVRDANIDLADSIMQEVVNSYVKK